MRTTRDTPTAKLAVGKDKLSVRNVMVKVTLDSVVMEVLSYATLAIVLVQYLVRNAREKDVLEGRKANESTYSYGAKGQSIFQGWTPCQV